MKKELNSENRTTAITTLAIPVATYSFNVVNWNLKELKKLDAKIRKQLTCNRMLYPKSDVAKMPPWSCVQKCPLMLDLILDDMLISIV